MPSYSYSEELNSILTRYQHHVADYDKQKWEVCMERRILHGINHIPTKSAKLQSSELQLIDLDLVRGSSFPKAKPKHGLFKVTRQAILRFLFLPFYHEWWTEQTSSKLFSVFLTLYFAQIAVLVIHLNLFPCYWLLNVFNNGTFSDGNFNSTPLGTAAGTQQDATLPHPTTTIRPFGPSPTADHGEILISEIQISEILSPLFLMIVLTILHSQIVATYGSKSEDSGGLRDKSLKNRRNSGKSRSKRRISRRRSTTKVAVNNMTPFHREGSQERGCYQSSASRRVFFQDESNFESKSWTSSNSDKDEGIVDEMVSHENQESGETEPEAMKKCGRRLSGEVQTIVEKNIIEANLNATIRKFAEEEAIAVHQQKQSECLRPTKDDLENCSIGNSAAAKNPFPIDSTFGLRSNLRKRNVSKVSEISTTSCADCSSNNNESSTEDEYREATMEEDEEMRSKSEWTAVTTNSEDDDYDEENINSEDDDEMTEAQLHDHPFAWEFQKHSMKTISPSCVAADKISVTIWDGPCPMKADLTVLDISSSIIAKVERAKENSDYIYLGIFFSVMIAFLPCFWRLNNGLEIDEFHIEKLGTYLNDAFNCAFLHSFRFRLVTLISIAERLCLSLFVFFLLAVAEKTYKQRFLYAKLFSRLTSTRKARKSGIPHFRLNKVRNIKIWLSIRSYLQRRGPQRSVDTIVSGTFITTLFLIFFLSVELLKDSNRMVRSLPLLSIKALNYILATFNYRSRISQKYRNLSVILTEQLNLYLKMEQKPHKKDELLVANNVLKLASELLKELEDPFKISSFASNPYLYNVTRLVILSAFSGVLSEMLGFKLKLYKIKIK
ncbi:putative homeodomain transcription factor 2 [Folsomia candida]|uniref:Putative homeodomain transcription factor 2 n=1 Tax=Folsomia candida TaxID=158441 RepID=A0A226EJZ6_FOLCA|nr:putative homeodomain transcription factor 2 [Folsomia candida]